MTKNKNKRGGGQYQTKPQPTGESAQSAPAPTQASATVAPKSTAVTPSQPETASAPPVVAPEPRDLTWGEVGRLFKSFKFSLGLVMGLAAAAGGGYGAWQLVESRLEKRLDEKIGGAVKELEGRGKAIETENTIFRKSLECYNEMQDAICRGNYEMALLAYEHFGRQHSMDTIPSAIRNTIYDRYLTAVINVGRFELMRRETVDKIAASLDASERKGCANTHLILGTVYLALNTVDEARTRLILSLRLQTGIAAPDEVTIERIYLGTLMTVLIDKRHTEVAEKVKAAMALLDECEGIHAHPYMQVYSALATGHDLPLIQHIRLSHPESFAKAYSALMEDIANNAHKMSTEYRNGHIVLVGTVMKNGKPVKIEKYWGSAPSRVPPPGSKEMGPAQDKPIPPKPDKGGPFLRSGGC